MKFNNRLIVLAILFSILQSPTNQCLGQAEGKEGGRPFVEVRPGSQPGSAGRRS